MKAWSAALISRIPLPVEVALPVVAPSAGAVEAGTVVEAFGSAAAGSAACAFGSVAASAANVLEVMLIVVISRVIETPTAPEFVEVVEGVSLAEGMTPRSLRVCKTLFTRP